MTSKEFDNLLRKVSAKPPVDCGGFDPDLATAYLEKKLSAKERASYQNHLSACAPCRRMITQLAELFQPEPLLPKTSLLLRLQQSLTASFVHLRYALPVIALTLAASVWLVLQTPQPEVLVKDSRQQPASPAQPLTPTETKSSVELASDKAKQIDNNRHNNKGGSVKEQRAMKGGKAGESVEADSLATESSLERANEEKVKGKAESEKEGEIAVKDTVTTDTTGLSREEAPRPSVEAAARSDQPAAMAAPTTSKADDAAGRRDAKKAAPREREATVRRVADKIFRLTDGVWVDEKYTDSQRLRVVRLRQGEQLYIEAVRNNPSLADYFNLGSRVIVVLDGVVYDYTGK